MIRIAKHLLAPALFGALFMVPTAFGATIDWSTLGGNFTAVPNGTVVTTSIPGLTATVTSFTAAGMERRDQGTGWAGDFLPGETLLWLNGSNGPLTLFFSADITSFSVGIQQNTFGPFGATLLAYDGSFSPLGSDAQAGVSGSTASGSEPVLSFTGSGIRYIVLDTDVHDFAINNVDFEAAGVPEPGTYFLVSSALGLLALARRKR